MREVTMPPCKGHGHWKRKRVTDIFTVNVSVKGKRFLVQYSPFTKLLFTHLSLILTITYQEANLEILLII